MLNSNSAKLWRIEILVAVMTLLQIWRFFLRSFRSRYRGRFNWLIGVLDVMSYNTMHYTLGLMQLVPFDNELLQVWAVISVTLGTSITTMSAFNLPVKENPLGDLMSSLWSANLLGTRRTSTGRFKFLLWSLWSLNSVRIIQGSVASENAKKSDSHGKNSRLVAEYMRHEHDQSGITEVNPVQMTGYKYLVLGETKQAVGARSAGYSIQPDVTHEQRQLITIDKVWGCDGRLLQKTWGDPDGRLKDVCLSFALYKLLRRRFDDLEIHEAQLEKTWDLVFRGILGNGDDEDYERAFRIAEAETAFLNDNFCNRNAILFANGFPVLRLVLSIMVIGVIIWLAIAIHRTYRRTEGEFNNFINEVNVDVVITYWVLVLLLLKELWEMVTFISSDWTKVLVLCKYVKNPGWTRIKIVENALRLLCNFTVLHGWQRNIYQCNLLFGSSRYNVWNRRYRLVVRKSRLPKEVKKAIVTSLKSLTFDDVHRSDARRPSDAILLRLHRSVTERFSWACNLKTHTHTILVWHIATCLCDIKLSRQNGNFDEELRSHYIAATSLSEYCAYLLRRRKALVPDHIFVPIFIFSATVRDARKRLQGCHSFQSILGALTGEEGDQPGTEGEGGTANEHQTDQGEEGRTTDEHQTNQGGEGTSTDEHQTDDQGEEGQGILEMGAKLAQELIGIPDEIERWELLIEFWTGIVLYLAASTQPTPHQTYLFFGGEFLTHLWALLSHAGIFDENHQFSKFSEQKQGFAGLVIQEARAANTNRRRNPDDQSTNN
ncbi:uncharacterized protein [Typha latifolia]|uniref:uncharacterized protein n=1 Tax=Typha latifolia TaxID=4733 RepID=UPI003C2CE452